MRVVVGLPVLNDMKGLMVQSLIGLLTGTKGHNLHVSMSLGVRQAHEARNHVIERAYQLPKEFDAILYLDDDMVFQPDTLMRLIERDKDVVGVLYPGRHEGAKYNVFEYDSAGEEYKLKDITPGSGMVQVDAIGTGVFLVKRAVLDRIGAPWFHYDFTGTTEDVAFCHKARAAGFKIWCDTDIPVGHIGEKVYGATIGRTSSGNARIRKIESGKEMVNGG